MIMLNRRTLFKHALFVGSLVALIGLVECDTNKDLFGEKSGSTESSASLEMGTNRTKNRSNYKFSWMLIQKKFYRNRTCENKWSKDELRSVKKLTCFRDSSCRLFRDCCHDDVHLKPAMSRTLYKCTEFPRSEHKAMYIVVKCPESFHGNSIVKLGCERTYQNEPRNRLFAIPVTGLTDGRIYANYRCAQCHRMPFIFWTLKIRCLNLDKTVPRSSVDFTLKHFHNARRCISSYERPPMQEDASCESYISACPPITDTTGQKGHLLDKIRTRCLTRPLDRVYSLGGETYKNVFCALCNGERLSDLDCLEGSKPSVEDLPPSFAVLFDFNLGHIFDMRLDQKNSQINQDKKGENKEKSKCPDGYMYNFYSQKCRKLDFHQTPVFNSVTFKDIVRKNDTLDQCNMIKLLNPKEFEWLGDSLFLKSSQSVVNKSSLFIDGMSAYLCLNESTNNNDTLTNDKNISVSVERFAENRKGNKIERWLTTFGLIISLVTLSVALLVFALIRKLQSLPGKMLTSLMTAMLVADLFFLLTGFAGDSKIVCVLLATILHYSLLVTFFWNNVMSYDTWNTFSKLHQQKRKTRAFRHYSLYAWFLPLLIVVCAFVIDLLSSHHVVGSPWTILAPQYGHHFCWISNRFALIIFFGLPVFLIIVANVCFFVLTSRAIYQADRFSSSYFSCRQKSTFGVYVKLCIIMGITCLLAFVQPFTQLKSFRCLSIFLNSFQGFFIGCIFLSSRNVRRILNRKLPNWMFSDVIHSSSTKLISSLKVSSQSS